MVYGVNYEYGWCKRVLRLHRFGRLSILLIAAAFPVSMHANTSTAVVTATIVSALTLTNQSGLVFGEIAAGNAPGRVILSPDGTRIATGGASINSNVSSGPAVFGVNGIPNAVYGISLPLSVVLTGSGDNNMVVNDFTSLPENTGLTDPGGQQSLFVGATLNLDSNQAIGSYTGTMSVTVAYN